MSANVFTKFLRKTSMTIHHQTLRSQSRKSLETLDQTLAQSNDEPVTIESTVSPKLSLASLRISDSPVAASTIVPQQSSRSPVSSFVSPALVPTNTKKSRLSKQRKSIVDEKFKVLQELLNMPVDSSQSEILTAAIAELSSLRGQHQHLSTSLGHMSQLLALTMKELGQVRAENKTLKTPQFGPKREPSQAVLQLDVKQQSLERPSPSARPPRHPPLSLKRPMYHDSFTYNSSETEESVNSSSVKLEPIDSLSRASSESSESSLFTLSQAASLVSEKPNLSSHQHRQLMSLMKLQDQYRQSLPQTTDSDKAEPISKRQRVELKASTDMETS